ncbi:maleylacetoacetate isomerase [Roseospira visakhapatnamensis]|uniref:Maleylacetoacetate isomerase/maleylpyruvate isomerase n=1 Tax=Roseospira visakhapatnamensis TaxID=390880 RepID=A0A7W6REG7_9PROT|nr:maleylacetoacetate isomerase [Roseospira visakhapatnamensis]MBB4266932.1 maleylacetoacetate isomerase/maleylpyruvate isomerase [Roseospira visakhapatnamensis]
MKLYTYWRSSAAMRVRMALTLKALSCEMVPVHLARNGGEHRGAAHLARHPQGLVPVLDLDGGGLVIQSLAIIEYLEETYPDPPLLPADALGRARVRALAQAIACEIHPLQNLRVRQYLTGPLAMDDEALGRWNRHWVEDGLRSVERLLADAPETGRFCHGDTPTVADCCLVPQLYNARRFGCDLSGLDTILRIDAACQALPAVQAAAPERQSDAE